MKVVKGELKKEGRITFLESMKKLQSWQTRCSCREDRDKEEKERTAICARHGVGHMAKREKEAQNVRKSTAWHFTASGRKGRRYREEELQHPQRDTHLTEPQDVYGAALNDSGKERHIKGIIILSTSLACITVSQPS